MRVFGPTCVVALAGLALAGCAQHGGRLIVVVDTDFDVPTELAQLHVSVHRVGADAASSWTAAGSMPRHATSRRPRTPSPTRS